MSLISVNNNSSLDGGSVFDLAAFLLKIFINLTKMKMRKATITKLITF